MLERGSFWLLIQRFIRDIFNKILDVHSLLATHIYDLWGKLDINQ